MILEKNHLLEESFEYKLFNPFDSQQIMDDEGNDLNLIFFNDYVLVICVDCITICVDCYCNSQKLFPTKINPFFVKSLFTLKSKFSSYRYFLIHKYLVIISLPFQQV